MRLLGKLPLGLGRLLGTALGRLCWAFEDRGSRTTMCNLQQCFPEKSEAELESIARDSMVETGRLAVEICQVWHKDQAWLNSKIVEITGKEILENAVAEGKGVIVLAPHIGNWEVLGLWLVPFASRCTYLYSPPKQPYLEPVMKRARERFGASTVPTSRRGIAELLKRLKNGEMTGILPDQVPDEGGGELSMFYGSPVLTMTLIHGLVQRTGCRVVAGVALRAEKGFHIHIREVSGTIASAEQSESLRALNQSVEDCINLAPEQYQWEYKRFKKCGNEKIY